MKPCIRRLAAGILMLTFLPSGNPAAQPRQVVLEYAIKAAYLKNFLQYVTWPAAAFPSQDSPVVIGILGRDPFGDSIDQAVEGRRVMGRRIEVRRVTLEGAATCHVVFMAGDHQALLSRWLRALQEKPILSITESTGEIPVGATIHFVMQGNFLRYDVNLDAAGRSGLKIATPLLVSARRLFGREPDGRDPR